MISFAKLLTKSLLSVRTGHGWFSFTNTNVSVFSVSCSNVVKYVYIKRFYFMLKEKKFLGFASVNVKKCLKVVKKVYVNVKKV